MISLLALPLLSLAVNAQFYAGCDVTKAVLELPTNQSSLKLPADVPPNSIALGVGVHNYTCSSSSSYTSAGAVAQFYDISCLETAPGPMFRIIQDLVFEIWNGSAELNLMDLTIVDKFATETWSEALFLGTHVFQPNPSGTGISPVFDYRAASRKQDQNAFVLAAETGSIPAPTDPTTDINWFSWDRIQGDLGTVIFMVDTVGGQPPTTCNPGSPPISVKFTAKYWFFGGPPSPSASGTTSSTSSAIASPASSTGSKSTNSENLADLGSSTSSDSNPSPISIALVVINGIFAIGILVAIFMHLSRRNLKQSQGKYVVAGAQFAPRGAMDEFEQELGPYDPYSERKKADL